ncbi:MAG TPA: endolytic transglycosylase MltG [Levilinea sp.]|nr:endolytic transglycosylase MltG [Levilinea sp.]
MASRRVLSSRWIILMLIVTGLCGMVAVGFVASQGIPRYAAQVFGAPSGRLSGFSQMIYAVRLILYETDLTVPADSFGEAQAFKINMGETASAIANRLEDQGLIRNAEAFRLYMVYAGLDTTVQAGDYQISPAYSAIEIARALQDATPLEVPFIVLAGWRIEEVAAGLPTSGLDIRPEDFLRAARQLDRHNLPPDFADVSQLEGFIFPGTYQFARTISVDDMIAAFFQRFNESVTPELRAGFERQGLSLYEAVILASIIQREAVMIEEAPMIASVFLNRHQIGMKLDSDPTVQYAVGYQEEQRTWWKNPLTWDDIATDSPYNTYQQAGFPPGPICSPGAAALQAVAFPAQSPYFFFRARCDGSGRHNFAVTYAEHLEFACE